jgi:hypothetical protein
MSDSTISSTLSNAIFIPEAGVGSGGETISGHLTAIYDTGGTLISETGTIVLTEIGTNGSLTTETFAINGTATTTDSIYGEGIHNNVSNGSQPYEIYLVSISSTGTGPVYSDLHLDWTSATSPELYLGRDGANYSALMYQGGGGTTLSNAGTTTSVSVACYAAGTLILTPGGQVAIECLAPGDQVLSARNGAAQTVTWAGRRHIDVARHANPRQVAPIRILAGAFADGLPERDLLLSPDHALFLEGHLVEAKTLVNGTTIIQEPNDGTVTYHHIELAQHDIILAEGLAAETYLESGNRAMFEGNIMALHPDFAHASRDGACAKLLTEGGLLRQIRQTLLNRAIALGFATTDEVDLTLRIGDERIRPAAGSTPAELIFILPANARDITLESSAGAPADVTADPSDRRTLGVAITGLALINGGRRTELPLSAAHEGVYASEAGYRWTNGAAQIRLPAYAGRAVLEVSIKGQASRWSRAPAHA